MLFSIIIPVYNVEQFLERCVDSVLDQEFSDYEIVLVNDGSTDGSLAICETYEKRKQVKLISKENGGLSSARNCGIQNASGDYIILLDSDDYIAYDCLEELSRIVKQYGSDIFTIKSKIVYEDNSSYDNQKETEVKEYSSDDYLEYLFDTDSYNACSPYMVYKRAFLENSNMNFFDKILHEDELWTPEILLKAETVCTSNVLLYYHYMRDGSITRSPNYQRRGESLVIVLQQLLEIPGFLEKEQAKVLRNQWSFLYLQAVLFLNGDNELKRLLPRKYVKKFAYRDKLKIKALIYSVSPRLYIALRSVLKGNL